MLLGAVVLAGLWYGMPAVADAVADRREQQRLAVEDFLASLEPPAGFRVYKCEVPQASCMTSKVAPEDSVDAVVALLAPHANETRFRCKAAGPPEAPPGCTVLADVDGVMVSALAWPRLMPDLPMRFSGTELWLSAVEGPYRPDVYFANEDMLDGR